MLPDFHRMGVTVLYNNLTYPALAFTVKLNSSYFFSHLSNVIVHIHTFICVYPPQYEVSTIGLCPQSLMLNVGTSWNWNGRDSKVRMWQQMARRQDLRPQSCSKEPCITKDTESFSSSKWLDERCFILKYFAAFRPEGHSSG